MTTSFLNKKIEKILNSTLEDDQVSLKQQNKLLNCTKQIRTKQIRTKLELNKLKTKQKLS